MQVDEFMEEPTGVGGDALLSTVVNHVAGREGPIDASELDMIFSIISSLQGRVSPEAMMMANAKLNALRTAQERVPEKAPIRDPEPELAETIAFEPVTSAFMMISENEASLAEEVEPASAAIETETEVEALPEADHTPIMLSSACPEAVAATCAPERLVALARCSHPSERLCSLIVSRGHAEALVAILRNPAARFAKSSLTTMVELAASDMSLREAMCARADLTDMILDRLWPYLSLSSRASVIAAGCESSHAEALVICADAAAEEACEINEDDSLRSIADWCGAVRNREESLSHAMRSLDQEGRIVDVAAMLAEFAGIEPAMALALMIGSYDRGAVALARLAGCDDDSMMSLIHLRGRAGARSTADKRGPLHAFAKMTEDEARSIIAGCFARLTQNDAPLAGNDTPEIDARAAA